ncbi:DegT/DnrJ/EryC1/StrS family aminotransferase, partial [bacterium]|nr:DegT/DnrJ/EryC1/StrS family aminotransferase [bacterium]
RREKIAARYTVALAGTGLVLPYVPAWAEPVWHLYVVQSSRRDSLQKTLKESGIDTLIHYPIPPHLQKAYAQSGYVKRQFPIAEQLASQVLSLPIGPQLDDMGAAAVIAALTLLQKKTKPTYES